MKTGRFSYNMNQQSILRPIKRQGEISPTLARNYDCAAVSFGNGCAVAASAVSSVLHARMPLALGFYRACNQLYSRRATVGLVNAAFVWPAETPPRRCSEAVQELAALCGREKIRLGAVTATASDRVAAGIVSLQAVGMSEDQSPEAKQGTARWAVLGRPLAGQAIVMAGHAGMAGAGILAAGQDQALLAHYTKGFVGQAQAFLQHLSILPAAAASKGMTDSIYPVQEGGILAALWNYADGAGLGLEADMLAIPIRQETVEISEFYRINPYMLAADGACLMAAADGPALAEVLTRAGIRAACIGHFTDDKARILRRQEEIRYLDKPGQEELERLAQGDFRRDSKGGAIDGEKA